jgi:hypothetical protein
MLKPGLLHGMQFIIRWGQAFDSRNITAVDCRNGRNTGTLRRAIDVHGARTALADPAAELGSCQAKVVANYPQQGRIGIPFERNFLGIDLE